MKKKTKAGRGTKKVDLLDKIIIYTDDKGNTELRADVEGETIWATQEQISVLFDCERSVVTKHLNNIFNEGELQEDSICANFAHMGVNGRKYYVKSYNLDAVIAVGYRVNSKKATQFRIWATKILREYVVRGYSLNNKLVTKSREKLEGLQEAISLIESTGNPGKLKGRITIKLIKNLDTK